MKAIFCCLLIAAFLAGCVDRTIVIESDPPGAGVWINEHPAGKTPVTHEFITHGRYKFRLKKPGFREFTAREMIRAPVYEWIPLDFIAENLLPLKLEDRHFFRYSLSPEPPAERLEVVKKADVKEWVGQLKDPDRRRRREAIVSLARQRDPETSVAVLEATHDPDIVVRSSALNAWRGIQGKGSIERLSEALLRDAAPQVRWQAAAELEALGDRAAVAVLLKALRDPSGLVRTGAAEALKTFADPASLSALIRALKDSDTSVRRAATEGLGRIGDKAAVRPLIKVLFHHDFQTRRLAVKSLAQLKDPASGPALVRTFTDWDPKVRTAATEALIAFGDQRVIPILIRRLRGLKPWTREHAARVLGGLKDPQAIAPLSRAFRIEPDPPASQAMYDALAALGAQMDPSWPQILAARVKRGKEDQAKLLKKQQQRKQSTQKQGW